MSYFQFIFLFFCPFFFYTLLSEFFPFFYASLKRMDLIFIH